MSSLIFLSFLQYVSVKNIKISFISYLDVLLKLFVSFISKIIHIYNIEFNIDFPFSLTFHDKNYKEVPFHIHLNNANNKKLNILV